MSGKFTALCGIVRMLYLACIALTHRYATATRSRGSIKDDAMSSSSSKADKELGYRPDIVLVDGISMPVPLLRLLDAPVLFYCHFPDKVSLLEACCSIEK
jgi:hypothetical protein